MNASFLLKKAPLVFLLFLFFVISFHSAEARRIIRVRRVKTHIAPRHISISARSGNGMYARRYAYGRPLPSYNTKGIIGSNRRQYTRRRRNGRRENISRNYASKYRNWSPYKSFYGNRQRADISGPLKKRKELLPFLIEPPFGPNKNKRRIRPKRPNAMQRPQPPKRPNEFDEDYFFPEEAKRAETKYEFENRRPRPKKKRRPEFEGNFKKPGYFPKIPYYDETPTPYKNKPREPPFSYSSFVQHPGGSSQDDSEDFYEDSDNSYSQPVVKNKKKRVKKKPNSKKKNKEQFKPFVFEDDKADESYPPYISTNEYDLPAKTYKKRNKPTYDNDDSEFLPTKNTHYSKPKPQINNLFSTDSDYRGSQNTQQVQQVQQVQYNPSYSPTWSQPSVVQTTARPIQYQTESGFQPQQYIPNQYNYNKDYSTLQKTKTVTTNSQQSTYYSQPDNTYKNFAYNNNNNYVSNQISTTHSQTPIRYNPYPNTAYSSQASPTYSQPLPSSSSVLSDITIQKSVPVYDNTETFYNFNNNAYVNSQSSKYYNSDSSTNKYYHPETSTHKYYDPDTSYGTRLSSTSTSYKSKLSDADSDTEFLKKHQNLYNNGLSGVPIQGDGYAKESTKKDYDIGYGDFQFDENPAS